MISYSAEGVARSVASVGRAARRGVAMVTVVVAALIGSAPTASASDLKCKIHLVVRNSKPRAIKVVKLHYPDQDSGEDVSEGLDNKKVAPGKEGEWKSENLGRVAEGNPVGWMYVEYRDDTTAEKKPSDPWGPEVKSGKTSQTALGNCKDGLKYTLEVK